MSSALAASRLVPPFARRLLVLPNARPPRVVAASSASSSSSRAGVVAMISASSSRATSAEASPTETETRSGSCFCGAIVVALTGTPAAVSICHCVNCRKLSGAPFTAQALAKATAVEVRSARDAEMDQMVFSPGGDADAYLTAFSSSAAVDRYRCKECGSPVYASLAKGKMAAVPLSMLDGGGEIKRRTAEADASHVLRGQDRGRPGRPSEVRQERGERREDVDGGGRRLAMSARLES